MKKLALLALVACGGPDPTVCGKVADKIADVWATRTSSSMTKASETWKRWLKEKDPNRDAVVTMCRRDMTEDQAECVVAAKDPKSVAACFSE